jgi:hypothetical protein
MDLSLPFFIAIAALVLLAFWFLSKKFRKDSAAAKARADEFADETAATIKDYATDAYAKASSKLKK